jgi:predicted N-acetyltransferase YhbS
MIEISMRLMTEGDLPAVDTLRQLAGWNQTPEDWRRMLRLEPEGCFVALREAKVVGTVTTTSYGQTLAWIGMMLVHPECRRQGIATRLMNRALEYLHGRGVKCVGLDATPAGFPVYEKLGFVSATTLARWQRPAGTGTESKAAPATETRALQEADWRAVNDMDLAAFGVARAELLRTFAQASQAALTWPVQGPVLGWGLLRPGARADYLGPLACSAADGALALARALLRDTEARPVFWDIPDRNEAAKAAAQRFGFAVVRPFTRMYLGPEPVAANPQIQYGIVDPAVG